MKSKTYIITTHTPGTVVHPQFFKSLKKYCKLNNAQLLIMLTKPLSSEENTVDPVLSNEIFVKKEMNLNKNLVLVPVEMSPTSANPINGLQSLKHGDMSIIVPGNIQTLQHLPTYDDNVRSLASTGSINLRNYGTSTAALKAANAHILGAFVIEVKDSKVFHQRNVISNHVGEFVDLGVKYGPSKTSKEKCRAVVLGDLHAMESDSHIINNVSLMISKKMKPARAYLHDINSGSTVTHHIQNDKVLLAKISKETSLKDEMNLMNSMLSVLSKHYGRLMVVDSNHSRHITDFVSSGTFLYDRQNMPLGAEFLNALTNLNMIPDEYYCKKYSKVKNITFLEEAMNVYEGKYLVSKHGHKGVSGTRALPKGIRSITGHTHSAGIRADGSMVTGHSCDKKKVNYLAGASSWTQSFVLVYKYGFAQLITIIDGQISTQTKFKVRK